MILQDIDIKDIWQKLEAEDKILLILDILQSLSMEEIPPYFKQNLEPSIDKFIKNKFLDVEILGIFESLQQHYKEEDFRKENFKQHMKSFEKWKYSEVEKHFGIQKSKDSTF